MYGQSVILQIACDAIFFKKECDESNPCAACLASHTSVLQVPCTRIDIKDLGYFMGTNNFQTSISILDAPEETEDSYKLYGIDEVLQIGHGFGYSLPISLGRSHGKAGPVKLSWVEFCHDKLQSLEGSTSCIAAATKLTSAELSDYVEQHFACKIWIDFWGSYNSFKSPEIKLTGDTMASISKFDLQAKIPAVTKALKLWVASNLADEIVVLGGSGDQVDTGSTITWPSRLRGLKWLQPEL